VRETLNISCGPQSSRWRNGSLAERKKKAEAARLYLPNLENDGRTISKAEERINVPAVNAHIVRPDVVHGESA
jgi:hypothetical protein